ncbi:hypothetical protein QTP88_026910 [Uroleucon formosanum]
MTMRGFTDFSEIPIRKYHWTIANPQESEAPIKGSHAPGTVLFYRVSIRLADRRYSPSIDAHSIRRLRFVCEIILDRNLSKEVSRYLGLLLLGILIILDSEATETKDGLD